MPRSTSFTKPNAKKTVGRAGVWVSQGTGADVYQAFLPKPLPPDPPLLVDLGMQRKLELASVALGRLDGIGRLLPGPDELLYSYVRKEAVLSSQSKALNPPLQISFCTRTASRRAFQQTTFKKCRITSAR